MDDVILDAIAAADEESIRRDFSEYTDPDGLVQPQRHPSPGASGNGLVYTSAYYILLKRRGFLTFVDLNAFAAVVKKCSVRDGLLKRGPNHPDQEGPDDYIAVTAASAHLLRMLAGQVLSYGQNNPFKFGPLTLHWNYCNVCPEPVLHRSSWMGRSPSFVAHLHYAAGLSASWFSAIGWCVAVLLSCFRPKSDQDARTLSWFLVATAELENRHPWVRRFFLWKLHRDFPNGMRDVIGNYFQNREHPLAKYWVTL